MKGSPENDSPKLNPVTEAFAKTYVRILERETGRKWFIVPGPGPDEPEETQPKGTTP